ncbi:MAG: AAA family ATPase, partial [Synergistaceae bacterium]|nr:AAA family ATPase [Synergistaceae bacterium]
QAMRELGLYPLKDTNLILDGKLHRYTVEGDKATTKNGAYCIHTDGYPAGYLQSWKTGVQTNWKFDISNFSEEQKKYFSSKEFQLQVKNAEKERIKREEEQRIRQINASKIAKSTFEKLEPAPHEYPYLQKKKIAPYNFRFDKIKNALAVPLHNINGEFQSLQWIFPNGDKKFFQDAPIKGAFWSIALDTLKGNNKDIILLGEGVATMAKVYELSGYPCVAAMNCGNLYDIAVALKNKFLQANIIIMADDDKERELESGKNPGRDAAQEVVQKNLAKAFLLPQFKDPKDGTDWDDFAIKYGDESVARYLKSCLSYTFLTDERKKLLSQVEQINAQTLRHKIFPPIVWAVDGFLPAGLSILAGGPKVGKSILSLHLSLAVAIGGCALGKINVEQGDVLYLALEDTQRRLQERIEGSELPENCNLSRLTLATRVPRQHEGGIEYIKWWLEDAESPRLVIIDTLQKFRKVLSNKGNMYAEDYEVVSEIKKLADQFNVPFLVIHHLKKAMAEDWLNEISGSQGIAGAADTIFALKRARTENKGILHRTGRDVEEKDFEMTLDNFGWVLNGDYNTMPDWKKQIVDYLKEHNSVTPMELSQALNLNINSAKSSLFRLCKEGLIVKIGYGTYALEEQQR